MKLLKKLIIMALITVGTAVCLSLAGTAADVFDHPEAYSVTFDSYNINTGKAYVRVEQISGLAPTLKSNSLIECTVTTPPDCTNDGEATYSDLELEAAYETGEEYIVMLDGGNVDIPALGHDWKILPSDDPLKPSATCTTNGWVKLVCKRRGCEETEYHENYMLDHNYLPTFTWADDYGTCTLTTTCAGCNNSYYMTINTTNEVIGNIKRYTADFPNFEEHSPSGNFFIDGLAQPIEENLKRLTKDVPFDQPDDPDRIPRNPRHIPFETDAPVTTAPEVTEAPEETTPPVLTEPETTTLPEEPAEEEEPSEEEHEDPMGDGISEPDITTVPDEPEETEDPDDMADPDDIRADYNPATDAALGGIALLTLAGAAIIISRKRK